jgi:hypothetical protein
MVSRREGRKERRKEEKKKCLALLFPPPRDCHRVLSLLISLSFANKYNTKTKTNENPTPKGKMVNLLLLMNFSSFGIFDTEFNSSNRKLLRSLCPL